MSASESFDLRVLSDELEAEAGYDSISTIQWHYRLSGPVDGSGPSAYECVFPDCTLVRRDPIKMWKHVHFSKKHGLSFGMSLEHLVAERLKKEGLPERGQT